MQLQTDAVNQDYAEWLAHLSYDPNLWGRIALPPYMTQLHDVTEIILTFRNDMVNDFNTDILHTMPGQEHVFDSVDSADVNDAEQGCEELLTEYLQSLSPAGLPPARLCLKVGAPIILLQNLYPK
ncbi:MAG: ATP-dependent DNA helicase [Lasallia pustulata]|uniref:ATP-dependent DNA helicase n=1 Tax=Lasallia pustulata TaxID=136370 RepID=A0A5M8PHZ0_9LECA|nr:MAG: ATP-dependent DNA helicase [Lasallia pustulata]